MAHDGIDFNMIMKIITVYVQECGILSLLIILYRHKRTII